ncbi:MAG: hypothetical protein NTV91_04435 [Proteobacteria bacterium]|nr:hypothetical protein [Pseudomonadota bacterium]
MRSTLHTARTAAVLAALCVMAAADLLHAQGIPNPLVRPQRGAETVPTQPPVGNAGQGSAPAQSRGATAAPGARGAASGRAGGEGLPEDQSSGKTNAETLAGLYVSAVIGDRAVLRSLDVRTVPVLAGAVLPTGGPSGGGSGGGGGAAAGGGGGGSANIAALRSQVFMVRNGEVLSLFDRLRVLVRVRDTTVTLFDVTDVPPGQYDPLDLMDRGFPVAFRGSIDSIQSLPPVPPSLIAPGEGVDGEAFERARNTSADTGSGGSSSSSSGSGNRGTSGGAGLPGNP